MGKALRGPASDLEVRGQRGRLGNQRRARARGASARGPLRVGSGGWGRGSGGWGRGGRGPLTITNRSPFQPSTLSHRFPATLDTLTQAKGPCGPKRLRRRRVARLSLAQSRRPRSSASLLGPQDQQQRPHFRFSCHSGKWFPEVPPHPARPWLGSSLLAFPLSGRSLLAPRWLATPPRFPALFSVLPSLCF